MLFFLLVFSFFFLSIFFTVCLIITYKKIKRLQEAEQKYALVFEAAQERDKDPTRLAESLLLEILPFKSAKWESFLNGKKCEDQEENGSGQEKGEKEEVEERGVGGGGVESGWDDSKKMKKKKKKGKKKKLDAKGEEENSEEKKKEGGESENSESGPLKPELVCLYPFTTSSSATQRKIKQQYDHLLKCHESKRLTLTQVAEFTNCLSEAKEELENKSEAINRKFTITKALLCKADRSSVDRLRQQLYKLEKEQKRLEDDAFVYNWLQQQLKLSPAYKKMLEVHASMEEKAKNTELTESVDMDEFTDISFEELLAQEKKDSFWLKNGRSRLS